jgi:FkbM family methyltransferase
MNADLAAVVRRRITLPFLRRFAPVRAVPANGRQLYADVRDMIIGRSLFLEGAYEKALSDLIMGLTSHLDGRWALDIGANIGLHSLALSEAVGSRGRVLAFEPESHNADLLTRSVIAAKVQNVLINRVAVGDHQGEVTLEVNDSNFGDHRISVTTRASGRTVPVTTIDAAISAAAIPAAAVAFAKIDVQGFELHVLRGMQRTIEQNPDMIIAVEVFPSALRAAGTSALDLVSEFRRLGFDGWELMENRAIPLPPTSAYELMRGEASTDLLLSRATEPLRSIIRSLYLVDNRSTGNATLSRGLHAHRE